MTDISKHPLLKECYDLCLAIEKCGASPELTDASMKASNLMRGIEALVNDDAHAVLQCLGQQQTIAELTPVPPAIQNDYSRIGL